jgi:hypothetical protein
MIVEASHRSFVRDDVVGRVGGGGDTRHGGVFVDRLSISW